MRGLSCRRAITIAFLFVAFFSLLNSILLADQPIITPPNSTFDHFHVNFTALFKKIGNWISPTTSISTSTVSTSSASTTSASTTTATSTTMTSSTSASSTSASTTSTTTSSTTTRPPIITPPSDPFDHFHLNFTELFKRLGAALSTSPTVTISIAYTSSAPTTTVQSTATTSATTSLPWHGALILPPPSQSSVLVQQGGNMSVSEGTPTGGNFPYKYQWLGSLSNSSGSFSANLGNQLCGSSSQTLTCTFLTVYGSNILSPGGYYIKLQASDSTTPPQFVNSSVIFFNVLLNKACQNGSCITTSTSTQTTTVQSTTTVGSLKQLALAIPHGTSNSLPQGTGFSVWDTMPTGGIAPYGYVWFVSYMNGAPGTWSSSTAWQLCGSSYQTLNCTVPGSATSIMTPGVWHYFRLRAMDSTGNFTNSTPFQVMVH